MDKRTKKKIDGLRKSLLRLRLQLKGAIEQPDEASDVEKLKQAIQDAEDEIERLKAS